MPRTEKQPAEEVRANRAKLKYKKVDGDRWIIDTSHKLGSVRLMSDSSHLLFFTRLRLYLSCTFPRRALVSLTTAVLERHCKWTQRVVGYKLLLRKAEAQAKESQRAQAKPDVIIDRDGHQ